MSVSTVKTLGLLLLALLHTSQVTLSHIDMCSKAFYLSEGDCKPCPAHCNICTNATHCTSCQMSYYGQICENECEEGCAGTCHKVYGHCTYGCEDGAYPDVFSLACLDCRKECKVCRSLTSCLVCHPGYHGESCRKTCSGLCKGSLCNTTDGTCFECKDGSYKAGGDCVVCPDGCAQCTDSRTCTVCNDGFKGTIDGRCLLECPNIYGDNNDPICGTGLCINLSAYWNISRNECQHAMEHLPNCYTEGVCATLESSLLNLEWTSHNATKYSLLYRTFKCSLECDEQVTRTLTGPCEGPTCIHKCELQETAYSNTNVYRRNETPPKTWVNSHCNIVLKSCGKRMLWEGARTNSPTASDRIADEPMCVSPEMSSVKLVQFATYMWQPLDEKPAEELLIHGLLQTSPKETSTHRVPFVSETQGAQVAGHLRTWFHLDCIFLLYTLRCS